MKNILTFTPVYVHLIWGGDRIARFKGIESQGPDVGESWELSPMPGHESVVDRGEFKGLNLNQLIDKYGNDIMGKRLYERYEGKFPLLIKFIDSKRDLSIQVHPDDELAAVTEHKRGKTEMWYSIDPDEGAYLYAGFKGQESPESLKAKIEDSTIVESLAKYYTKPRDVFFLPAGCVHAIGQGNFVAEIQEASDVTYRIFDYNRVGADGKPRELHVAKAMVATKYDNSDLAKPINVTAAPDTEAPMVHCPFFNTDLINVDPEMNLDLKARDSFSVFITVSGELTFTAEDNEPLTVGRGTTILVPASVDKLKVTGNGEMISVYVP